MPFYTFSVPKKIKSTVVGYSEQVISENKAILHLLQKKLDFIFNKNEQQKRQVFGDLVGTVPNLNYKCFLVCSRFFTKIIFRYT